MKPNPKLLIGFSSMLYVADDRAAVHRRRAPQDLTDVRGGGDAVMTHSG